MLIYYFLMSYITHFNLLSKRMIGLIYLRYVILHFITGTRKIYWSKYMAI